MPEVKESKHKHTQCMECSQSPRYEIIWAEGMGHAWFCENHFRKWISMKDSKHDVCECKEIKDGQASKKFGENRNPNIWDTLKKKWNLKENISIPLKEIKDWKTYNPANETDNKILVDDFRLLSAKYSNEKAGEKTEYDSVENVIKTAEKTVNRILELKKITFHPEQMKETSLELLKKVLNNIIESGPYLSPPHGELIWRGKKTAIIKKARLDKLEDMGILASGKMAYGFLRAYEPDEIGLDEFEKRADEHRLTGSEIEGMGEKFHYYKIREFIPFDKPEIIESSRVPGQLVKSAQVFESTFLPKDWNIQKITNAELIKLHAEAHDESTRFSQETGKPPNEGIIDKHVLIIEEIRRRGLEHRPVTELDKLSMKFVTENKVNFDDVIKLSDLMNLWQEGFTMRKPLLSFTGGACVSGWGKNIDININWPAWDEKFLDALSFRLKSFLPPQFRDKVHLVPDQSGPFTNFVPFATLEVKMLSPEERKVIKMSSGVFREQRITDEAVKKQAEVSRKADSVKPFRFFIQAKSMQNKYSIDNIIESIKQSWMRESKFPAIQIDSEFDSARVQIHGSSERVNIWNDEGIEVTNKFPELIKEAKAQKKTFVAEANITGEGKANVFDCIYFGDEDLHKKPLSERQGILEKLKSGEHFNIADKQLVQNETELKTAIKKFSESGGAMLKLWDGDYSLTGITNKWMKFKKEADLNAEVVEVHRARGLDSYNYLCAIRDGDKRVPVGRVFNVRFEKDGKPIQVPVGGIIRTSVLNVSRYTDINSGEVWYNWLLPRAVEYREDKAMPDTVDMASRLVEATGGEIEEKCYPKRYDIAIEKLKEGYQELKDYDDWLSESYPMLHDLDEHEYRLLESIGEDELNEERKKAIKEAGGFPFRKKKIKESVKQINWTLSRVLENGSNQYYELLLDFGNKQLQKYKTRSNPIFQNESAGVLESIDMNLSDNNEIKDKGTARIIERSPDLIQLNFSGRFLKGLKILKREDPENDVWAFKKFIIPGVNIEE